MGDVHPDLSELVVRRLAELGLAGRPMSYRAAEARAAARGKPLNKETIRRIALGIHSGRIADETVDGLAAALDVPRAEVLRHMHETRVESLGPWQAPDAAHRLTFTQRRALEQLIRSMVNPLSDEELAGLPVQVDSTGAVALGTSEDADREVLGQELDEASADELASRRRTGRGGQ